MNLTNHLVKDVWVFDDADPRIVISFIGDNSLLVYSKKSGAEFHPPHAPINVYEYKVKFTDDSEIVIQATDDAHAKEEASYLEPEKDVAQVEKGSISHTM